MALLNSVLGVFLSVSGLAFWRTYASWKSLSWKVSGERFAPADFEYEMENIFLCIFASFYPISLNSKSHRFSRKGFLRRAINGSSKFSFRCTIECIRPCLWKNIRELKITLLKTLRRVICSCRYWMWNRKHILMHLC